MLDVNLRLRGVQVSEVAEDPAVTLMSRVAADGGGSLRPGCGGIGPNGVRETVLIWGRRRFECDECGGAYLERLTEFAG